MPVITPSFAYDLHTNSFNYLGNSVQDFFGPLKDEMYNKPEVLLQLVQIADRPR